MIYILYTYFRAISINRNRGNLIPKILEKSRITAPPVERFFPKADKPPIKGSIIQNIKVHEILCISTSDTLATNFLSHTHRQTDIFQK